MALSSSDSITIGEETFSLFKIPEAGTALVKKEKDSLLGELDLKSLVDDLGKLGSFIRVAYNGVAGNTELQIKVQRVGYKITKLTDESAVTVHKFKQTSRSVLQELQCTYQFLLDGLEDMALGTLAALAEIAKTMETSAYELHKKFDEAITDVIDASEDTQRTKGVREERKKELQKQQEDFELKRKKAEQLQKDAMEAKEKAELRYEQAQKREEDAYKKQDSLLNVLKDSVVKVFSASAKVASLNIRDGLEKLSQIGEDSTYKEAMRSANEEKMKHLEDMQKQRDERSDAIQQCIEFTEKIKQCETDEGLEEVAIEALHNSIGALRSLSAVMMNAALFWHQMQAHCESLASEDMQRLIEIAMKYPEKKRLTVWTSTGFKTKGITYYSRWVALDDVCGTYMEQIKQTRQDLYKQIQENPTIEESRKNVRQLAVKFEKELKEARKQIDKKKAQTSKEMKSLEEEK